MNTHLKLKVAVAGLLMAMTGMAAANPATRAGGLDYARVVDVTPIVQRVRISTPARAQPAGQVSYAQVPVTVDTCQDTTTFREEERIQGYRVTYVYADREYVTTMASHPGTSIPVRVTVLPSTGNF